MKNLILIYCLLVSQVFGQSINPNDQLKLGNKASSSDKGIVFETGDGVSNKKLLIEKISKKLKWDGNSVQFGDGSPTSDKELIIAGSLKSLKYNGTSGEFEFNDDLKLSGELKTDILRAINSEIAVKNALRAELGVKFGTGDAEIKYDSGLGSLVFSNDGIFYKKVGSGGSSGGEGGTNLLLNPSFEETLTNWTASGGTLVNETYANPVEGDLSYAKFTATTASQTVCSATTTTPSFFGAGGMVDFSYTGTGTAFIAYVKDGSGNKLTAPQALQNQTLWTKLSPIAFSFNSSQMLCFESTGAGEIKLDKAYLGSNKNVNSTVYIKKQSSTFNGGNGFGSSGTAIRRFTTQLLSDGNGIYEYVDSATNGASFTFLKDALVEISYTDSRGTAAAASFGVTRNYNTLTTAMDSVPIANVLCKERAMGTSAMDIQSCSSVVQVSAGDIIRPNANGFDPSGLNTVFSIAATVINNDQVQTPEAASWFIDANIGGANVDLTNNAYSSYTELTNASLDLVKNAISSDVQIACASGTDSTGLTCSSAESVGVTFTNPSAGAYEACFSFSAMVGTSGVVSIFQAIETTPTSSAIVSEGNTRSQVYTGTVMIGTPVTNCGIFKFNDSKRRTIRLMIEKNGGGAPQIFADRDGGSGQRDIHITIRPLLQNSSRAILTGDQLVVKGTKNPKLCSFAFSNDLTNEYSACTTTNCTIWRSIGNCNPSVTRYGTGDYYVDFPSGTWESKDSYNCTYSVQNWTTAWPSMYVTQNQTSTRLNYSGTYDWAALVTCIGY